MQNKISWEGRISEHIKEKINIEGAKKLFEKKIDTNIKKGSPEGFAIQQARKAMLKLLKEKGVSIQDATHFLHVCEVTPYSGCGCCEHRKPKGMRSNYEIKQMY